MTTRNNSTNKPRIRLFFVCASSIIGLLLARWIWGSRAGRPTVALVDNRELAEAAFAGREKPAAAGPRSKTSQRVAHWPLSDMDATRLFSSLGSKNTRYVPDPQTYYWVRPNHQRKTYFKEHPDNYMDVSTNDMGFRKGRPVMRDSPEIRILVTGDSHTEGVVSNPELFTEQLETDLAVSWPNRSVEVLNGGKGGFSFYNYLGVLEKFEHLEPDIFIVTVYGGNDFVGVVKPRRYFQGLPLGPPLPKKWRTAIATASKRHHPIVSQFLIQALALLANTQDRQLALEGSSELIEEIHSLCKERGTRLLLVYLPAAIDVQAGYFPAMIQGCLEIFGLDRKQLDLTDKLATQFLKYARSLGIPCVDLRFAFQNAPEFMYWKTDHHINVRGHRLIAETLKPVVEQLVGE